LALRESIAAMTSITVDASRLNNSRTNIRPMTMLRVVNMM
jgi:hypothetical protein